MYENPPGFLSLQPVPSRLWQCFLPCVRCYSSAPRCSLIFPPLSTLSTHDVVYQTPKDHATYLTSVKFARDMLRLCARAGPIFENEPRCLFIQSPVYVFGDIHGNLEVSHHFSPVWAFGGGGEGAIVRLHAAGETKVTPARAWRVYCNHGGIDSRATVSSRLEFRSCPERKPRKMKQLLRRQKRDPAIGEDVSNKFA